MSAVDDDIARRAAILALEETTDGKLQAINLKGIEDDESAGLALLAEKPRLVLYGSLAVIGGALTTAWAGDREVCDAPFHTALLLLLASVSTGWAGLNSITTLRFRRIVRKYLQLEAARATVFKDDERYPTVSSDKMDEAILEERLARERAIDFGTWGWICGAFGMAFLIAAALPSITGASCYSFTPWPLEFLN